MHTGVEVWEKSFRTMKPTLVLDAYEQAWQEEEAKAWAKEPNENAWQRSGVKKTRVDLGDRYVRGRDQLTAYMEATRKERLRPWVLPDTGWVASEVPFEEDFGGVMVKGFIDLIMEDPATGALLVRDVKTGTKKPVGFLQLATYRWALKKKYGIDTLWGDYWMCKDNAPSQPIPLGHVPEALITSQFQIMDHARKEQLYAANVGDHCTRCDVARHCPFVGGEAPEGIHFLGT